MSRSSHKKHDNLVGRDSFHIAKRRLPLPKSTVLREFEDRRTFNPESWQRPARGLSVTRGHRFKVAPPPTKYNRVRGVGGRLSLYSEPYWQLMFDQPRDVAICIRRHARREVLHALKIAGRKGMGSPHYNLFSKVKC